MERIARLDFFSCGHAWRSFFFFKSFKTHSLFIFSKLLRPVYVSLLIICSLLHTDVQLRGSLDNRCAAAPQTHTALIDSELSGYRELQQTTNQISHIISQGFYCFLPQWICRHAHSRSFSLFSSNNNPTKWSLWRLSWLSCDSVPSSQVLMRWKWVLSVGSVCVLCFQHDLTRSGLAPPWNERYVLEKPPFNV